MANEHSTSCLVDRDALTLLTDAPVQPLKSEVRYNSIRTMSICRIYNVGTKTQNETLTAQGLGFLVRSELVSSSRAKRFVTSAEFYSLYL
jgi:hypothetical protein